MNKKMLGLISACALLASGCTSMPTQIYTEKDVEPVLVGKPVAQRIGETENEINNQVALLTKIQSGQKVGSYNVVTHNNNLDARVGSSQTLPQAYAKYAALERKENIPQAQKVKKIEWQNNSLNKLAGNIASALGYQLVIKGGEIGDKNINFMAQDQTLPQVAEKLKREVAPFADIVIIEKNKTFNIFYK